MTLKREEMKIYLKELKMYKINKSSVMIILFAVHAEQRILLMMNDVRIVKKLQNRQMTMFYTLHLKIIVYLDI